MRVAVYRVVSKKRIGNQITVKTNSLRKTAIELGFDVKTECLVHRCIKYYNNSKGERLEIFYL